MACFCLFDDDDDLRFPIIAKHEPKGTLVVPFSKFASTMASLLDCG